MLFIQAQRTLFSSVRYVLVFLYSFTVAKRSKIISITHLTFEKFLFSEGTTL